VIARLLGLALDARVQRRGELHAAARTSRWIAGNALALRGRRLFTCGDLGAPPWVARIAPRDLGELLAALALAPSLLAAEDVPARWRFALRALGVPTLDVLVGDALERGVSVLTMAPYAPVEIEIEHARRSYVARVRRARRLLAA